MNSHCSLEKRWNFNIKTAIFSRNKAKVGEHMILTPRDLSKTPKYEPLILLLSYLSLITPFIPNDPYNIPSIV